MPAIQPTPLSGPGTFNQAAVPPTNSPVTVAASGSISLPLNSQGYIVVRVTDSISGRVVADIADTIRPAEKLSGVKNFNIKVSTRFTQAASLQVSVSSSQLGDGAAPSSAPAISGASLAAFAANPVAVQGQI